MTHHEAVLVSAYKNTSEGCTPANCDCVSLMVDTPCESEG